MGLEGGELGPQDGRSGDQITHQTPAGGAEESERGGGNHTAPSAEGTQHMYMDSQGQREGPLVLQQRSVATSNHERDAVLLRVRPLPWVGGVVGSHTNCDCAGTM